MKVERRAALMAGFSLLVMAGVAGYANLGLIEHGAQLELAAGLMGVVAVLDVLVGVALLRLFGAAARFSSAARVIYAAVLALAVVQLTQGTDPAARAAAFHQLFDPALGLFGVHLLLLAFVFARPQRWLAALVGLTGAGYFIDALAPFVGLHTKVATVTFFGELVLMGWLIAVAGKTETR